MDFLTSFVLVHFGFGLVNLFAFLVVYAVDPSLGERVDNWGSFALVSFLFGTVFFSVLLVYTIARIQKRKELYSEEEKRIEIEAEYEDMIETDKYWVRQDKKLEEKIDELQNDDDDVPDFAGDQIPSKEKIERTMKRMKDEEPPDLSENEDDADDQGEHLSRGKGVILYKCPFCRSGQIYLCYEAEGDNDILIEKRGQFLAFALGSSPHTTKTMLYIYEPPRNRVKPLGYREHWKCGHCDAKCRFDGYNLWSPDRPEKICVEDAHQFGDRFNFDNRERLFEQLKEKSQKYEKIHD